MPLYEYECDACGQRFEIIQRFSDPVPDACRICGKGPVRRLLSSPAIQFKGTGWYVTDYAQKGKSSEAASSSTPKAESKDTSSSSAGSDAGKPASPTPSTSKPD
jgi:putative FmdB family regulatory protein